MKRHSRALLALTLAATCLGGCATAMTARTARMTTFAFTAQSKRVVLVDPDVTLGELTAGGVFETRADWTESAQGFVRNDIRDHFAKSGAEVVPADHATPHEIQLAKLHGAVGQAIITHLYGGAAKLPTKMDALDWTLGPGTNEMRDHYGADYALFIYVRDSYSTAGRQALQVLGILSAAAGVAVYIPGGAQIGFASLVDLRTGNIVWFNRLARESGDLRTEGPAQATVAELIKGIPL